MKTIRGLLRRKLILAAAVAVAAFSTVYAFAATLGVNSNSLSAGNAAVTSCTNSVTASYSTAYDATIPGYKVTQVTLANVVAACVGKTVTIALTKDPSNTLYYETSATISSTPVGGNLAIPVGTLTGGGPVSAATVTGISVVVSGP